MTRKEIRELRDKLSDMEFEKKVCPDCNGSGVYQEYDEYDRYTVHSCATCDGSGEIARQSVKSEEVAECRQDTSRRQMTHTARKA